MEQVLVASGSPTEGQILIMKDKVQACAAKKKDSGCPSSANTKNATKTAEDITTVIDTGGFSLKSYKAFTLIELLVVIALIGILSAVGIVSYSGYTTGAKQKNAELSLNTINLGLQEYKSSFGSYYSGALLVMLALAQI